MMTLARREHGLAAAALMAAALWAQAPKPLVGTVTGFRPAEAALEVKRDGGEAEVVRMGPETVVQRVAPGERDLKKAEPMKATDVAIGDRVLWIEKGQVKAPKDDVVAIPGEA